MNKVSRTITGIALIIICLVLIILSFFFNDALIVLLIYGIPLFIIGFFILFNKKEDDIEQRKDVKENQVSNQTRKTHLKGGKKR